MRCPRALALTALVLPLDDAHAPSALQPFFTRHAVNEARQASFAYLLGAAAGPAGSGARPSLFTYVNDVT